MFRYTSIPHFALSLGAAVALTGCASDAYITYDTNDGNGRPGDDDDDIPGEDEDDYLALQPAQTDVHVFIANPSRDTVSRVHVYDLAIDTAPVGRDPHLVQTTPDYRTAVVFNRGDDTLTLLDAASLEARTVPVRDNLNQMVMSPNGVWAVLWHDVASVMPDDPPPVGIVSYNEASFVNLRTAEHVPMAVGFNPKMVRFTPNSNLAIVVSDATLALVDLTVPTPFPELIDVAPNPLDPPTAEELVVAPDGSYAFVRQLGAAELVVVDLSDRSVGRVPVGATPTDLDLSPDGQTAVVVSRGDQQLWMFDVADPFAAPTVLDLPAGHSFGSLLFDPQGRQGLLYTNALPVDRYASWDLATDVITVRSLVKPVANMVLTPTGESLVILHTLEDAPGSTPITNPFHGYHALTVVELATLGPNPLRLPDAITGYANSNNGDFGYFIMDSELLLEVLDYRSLLYEEIPLDSVPVHVGALPDLRPQNADQPPAWVSQEHGLGRMTFFDADDGNTETITGFELNSHVEER